MTIVRSLHDCPAPAKLNLFLHVTGRRADGYHLLQTAFQLLDRCDMLDFDATDDGIVRRANDIAGVPEAEDLVVRAAKSLQAAAWPAGGSGALGATIRLHKRLPMGGGLGGGSSDAATALIVLNHLWQTGLTRSALMELGIRLGADVPFFLLGANAFAEGIGEALLPLGLPERWFVVIEPGVSVPTADIFGARQLTRDTKPVTMTDFSKAPKGFGKNDLQAVAAMRYPPVAEAVEWLSAYGDARMTGSGACVFCPFDDERLADEALQHVPSRWKAWKAKSLNSHPLSHLLIAPEN